MNLLTTIARASDTNAADVLDPHRWVGRVLEHHAKAEQALGQLSLALDLPISGGSLTSLEEIRRRLAAVGDKRCKALNQRVGRWMAHRPFRHLLAHATHTMLIDPDGGPALVTRHLPRDAKDVTPDRMWSESERRELLRQASNDGRSICDTIRNLLDDAAALHRLRQA